MKSFSIGLAVGLLLLSHHALAHGPQSMPLQRVPIPPVPGLTDGADPIVVNKNAAIALGKALFWDTNVGSDGMACGSCHFHAGADSRVKNQLNPGLKSSNASGQVFGGTTPAALVGKTQTGATAGPNYTMRVGDFPLRQYSNVLSKASPSAVTYSTDDTMASSGTFSGQFTGVSKFTGANDQCNRSVDAIFHVGPTGTRRIEPRNAPTVINTIFNHRNFWDGRANNVFNGSSPWGDRDPNAGVWVKLNNTTVQKQKLHLINSSLASLATGPALSDTEMSCQQRIWPDIGRKMLLRQPLQNQKVHNEDGVLGTYSLSSPGNLKSGLNTTYQALIKQAFSPKYWSYIGTASGAFGAPSGGTPYNQMEANFSMFFALSLQLYESTLVSDQAPIDLTNRDAANTPTWDNLGYSASKIATLKRGETAFIGNHCQMCHGGPVMTIAAVTTNAMLLTPTIDPNTGLNKKFGPAYFEIDYGPYALGGTPTSGKGGGDAGLNIHGNVITRDLAQIATGQTAVPRLMDLGFANTGVADPNSDPGVDAVDDFGHPLSFAKQYVQYLQNAAGDNAGIYDSVVKNQWACDFLQPIAWASDNDSTNVFTNSDGLIEDGSKEGTLRNTDCLIGVDPGPPVTSTMHYLPEPAAAVAAAGGEKMAIATKAAFKVPSLRNIELTGPYMHNGSMSTLEQVVQFYARKGNFDNVDKHKIVNDISLSASTSLANSNRTAIVEFLKTFTDDRVRYEKAPFDHPEITVPNGHVGDELAVTPGNPINANFAQDSTIVIPAVGANGSPAPLQPFDAGLAP